METNSCRRKSCATVIGWSDVTRTLNATFVTPTVDAGCAVWGANQLTFNVCAGNTDTVLPFALPRVERGRVRARDGLADKVIAVPVENVHRRRWRWRRCR